MKDSLARQLLRLSLPVCGIVFLFSSVLKAFDFQGFAVQVSLYGIVRKVELVRLAALVAIGCETMLGSGLLLGVWLRRVTIPVTLVVLVAYTALLFYAWLELRLADCGCFGSYIQMSPQAAIIKNLVLMILLGAVWFDLGTSRKGPIAILLRIGESVRAAIALALSLVLVLAVGYTSPHSRKSSPQVTNGNITVTPTEGTANEQDRPFAKFRLVYDEQQIDLGTGIYFVAMLSDSCEHCGEAVESLNTLLETPDFPPIVALCLGEDDILKEFRERYQPKFPTVLIDPLEFLELIGEAPPRYYLVLDGKIIHYWDETLPAETEVFDALFDSPQQ